MDRQIDIYKYIDKQMDKYMDKQIDRNKKDR